MPGCQQREASAELAKEFKWKHIQVSDLLNKEVDKHTEKGNRIKQSQQAMKFGKYLNSETANLEYSRR